MSEQIIDPTKIVPEKSYIKQIYDRTQEALYMGRLTVSDAHAIYGEWVLYEPCSSAVADACSEMLIAHDKRARDLRLDYDSEGRYLEDE